MTIAIQSQQNIELRFKKELTEHWIFNAVSKFFLTLYGKFWKNHPEIPFSRFRGQEQDCFTAKLILQNFMKTYSIFCKMYGLCHDSEFMKYYFSIKCFILDEFSCKTVWLTSQFRPSSSCPGNLLIRVNQGEIRNFWGSVGQV